MPWLRLPHLLVCVVHHADDRKSFVARRSGLASRVEYHYCAQRRELVVVEQESRGQRGASLEIPLEVEVVVLARDCCCGLGGRRLVCAVEKWRSPASRWCSFLESEERLVPTFSSSNIAKAAPVEETKISQNAGKMLRFYFYFRNAFPDWWSSYNAGMCQRHYTGHQHYLLGSKVI